SASPVRPRSGYPCKTAVDSSFTGHAPFGAADERCASQCIRAGPRGTPMQWNFLKKSWLFPIRDALRRCRRKSPPARPHARLCLEQLEIRTVPTTITPTSASVFYNDLPGNLTSAYASYQITNTDGVNHPDVWATIGNFTAASGSPVVTLPPGAPGGSALGPLANGQTKTVFFYLGSSADTNVTQTHTVSVFNGPPASGALLTSQDFSFTSVQSTIKANSNKVTSVVVSPSTPTV